MYCIADLSLLGHAAALRCAMRWTWVIFALLALQPFPATAQSRPAWHEKRQLPSDLEIGGDLVGLPPRSTRYVTREELLAMPQVNYTVSDDSNFAVPTQIGGVELEALAKQLGAAPEADTVIAICDDRYLAPYPPAYLAAHQPVLVLTVNGQPPEGWPKAAEDHTSDMGPYMISNPKFTPRFKVLAHADQVQIPWGVARIEFREEKTVFGAIAPQGPHAKLRAVQDGFQIAGQNCLRCHNAGEEGGRKSGVSWEALAALAASSADGFGAYIRAPSAQNSDAQMPGNPQYDQATLRALTLYFQTFVSPPKP
jgi:mono/diheme cytochrome c family protein